jgi:hypothetical protein
MKSAKWLAVALGMALSCQTLYAQEASPPQLTDEASAIGEEATQQGTVARADRDAMVRSALNSIWVEGLGAGLLYSVNYERMVLDDLGARVGFAYYAFGASVSSGEDRSEAKAKFLVFPITASYLGISSESKKHCLELGGGATIIYATAAASGGGMSAEGSGIGGFGQVLTGYRIQPADGGFHFRVGLMALFGPGLGFSVDDPSAWGVLPWGYISFGGSF